MKVLKETWKCIRGYQGRYEVSNFGRIRSWSGKGRYAKGKINKCKFIKVTTHYKNKYLMVTLKKSSPIKCRRLIKTFLVHRLVALAFIPNNKKHLLEVSHIDHNRQNNKVTNLMWECHSSNIKRSYLENRTVRGSLVGTSKLSEKSVVLIKKKYTQGFSSLKLAKLFKVDRKTIDNILRGRSWKYLLSKSF